MTERMRAGARWVTAGVMVWAVALHAVFFFSAGALWRDEANSIQQARMESWPRLFESLQYDSFPALYPALLRLWSWTDWTASDAGLRLFGLLLGLALLAALWAAARPHGAAVPAAAFALVAVDPLLVSEGDSIRPYGLGLLTLVWAYVRIARAAAAPSARALLWASAAAVLAVQSNYMNAFHIGVLLLSGACAARSAGVVRPWRVLLPGLPAALSLLPYAETLRAARQWASIVGGKGDWLEFLRGYASSFSAAVPAAWVLFILAGVAAALWGATPAAAQERGLALRRYAWMAGIGGLIAQVGILLIFRLPLFPRYFLPVLVLLAIPVGARLRRARPALRNGAICAALLVTAWPAARYLRTARTNADSVAAVLTRDAAPADIIIISPWFLHTSFQHYYRGRAEWMTVPPVEPFPMMRYDRVLEAMLDPQREARAHDRVAAALERGASVWFVSQRKWTDLSRTEPPQVPAVPRAPGPNDYVRFRSYWERNIEFRLAACCEGREVEISERNPRVHDEENLILTRWEVARPGTTNR